MKNHSLEMLDGPEMDLAKHLILIRNHLLLVNKPHIEKMLRQLVEPLNIVREIHGWYVEQYQDMKLLPEQILQDQHESMLDIDHYENKHKYFFLNFAELLFN